MTSCVTVYDQLLTHPFLAGLPSAWLRRLATFGRLVTWPATSRLMREGSPADQFWLLTSGVVELDFHLPGRGNVAIERIGAGDLLGWSWLTRPYRSSLGAVVVERCHTVELRAAPVRDLITDTPAFGVAMATRVLASADSRLQATRLRFVELCVPAPLRPADPDPIAVS
jgi:CRP/FNR family cyclic AMP-dependent transcriptional regulator